MLAGAVPVLGELGVGGTGLAGQRRRDGVMQPRAFLREQPSVEDLADQAVPERHAAILAVADEDLRVERGVHRGRQVRAACHALEHRMVDPSAGRRDDGEHLARPRPEPVDPQEHGVGERVRHLVAVIAAGREQLLDEERVAAGARVEPLGHLAGDRAIGDRLDLRGHVRGCQWRQVHAQDGRPAGELRHKPA